MYRLARRLSSSKAPLALEERPGSVPSIHTVAQITCHSRSRGPSSHLSLAGTRHAHGAHTYKLAKLSYT